MADYHSTEYHKKGPHEDPETTVYPRTVYNNVNDDNNNKNDEKKKGENNNTTTTYTLLWDARNSVGR